MWVKRRPFRVDKTIVILFNDLKGLKLFIKGFSDVHKIMGCK